LGIKRGEGLDGTARVLGRRFGWRVRLDKAWPLARVADGMATERDRWDLAEEWGGLERHGE
jgi:hypothetical protein